MVPGACLDRHRYLALQHFSITWHGIRGYLVCPMHARLNHLLAFKERSRVIGLKVQAVRHLHTISGYIQLSLCRKNPHIILPLDVCENKCAEGKTWKISRNIPQSSALWVVGISTFSLSWQWATCATVTGARPTILMSLLIGSGRTKAR